MSTGANLIFLISQPRAGSTLLHKILGAHPHIHTASEPWIALHPLFALRDKGISAYYSHTLAREATREFVSERVYIEGLRLLLNHLYDDVLRPSGRPVFLDKTPRYYFIVPELRRVFPRARFVFLIRNPLATFASILESWVQNPLFASLYAFRTDFLHDVITAPEILASVMESPSGDDTFVRYEDLVHAPAAQIERLCKQLGVPYQSDMIEYGTGNLPHWTFGDQTTVYSERRPIAERAERWRWTLRPDTPWNGLACSYLGAIGRVTVERLGYDYDSISAALAASRFGIKGPPPFLQNSVMTAAYGESCDYLSQSAYFQRTLDRLAAAPPPLNYSAEEQEAARAHF